MANKKDLEDKRAVSEKEIREFCSERNLPYFEVSAKAGKGIDVVFDHILREVDGSLKGSI